MFKNTFYTNSSFIAFNNVETNSRHSNCHKYKYKLTIAISKNRFFLGTRTGRKGLPGVSLLLFFIEQPNICMFYHKWSSHPSFITR